MLLDIKVLQYLYTSRCETEKQVFEVDGKASPKLFGFPIPQDAIFTLFSYYGSSLDLTNYNGDSPVKVDLEPGAGHFNIAGDNTFLFGYGTHVESINTPPAGEIIIFSSLNHEHTLFLHKEHHTDIVLRAGAHVNLDGFDAQNLSLNMYLFNHCLGNLSVTMLKFLS